MSTAEFCCSFYHVPEIRFGQRQVCRKRCLAHRSCIIGRKAHPKSQPRRVKALVVLRKANAEVCSRIYCNLSMRKTTKHAEEFFDEDVRIGYLGYVLHEIRKSTADPLEICMYITYQPCHFSTRKTPRKSCSDMMVLLYQEVLKPLNVEFIVKPTLIYKAYWIPNTANSDTRPEIIHAKEGIQRLFTAGIDIQAMEESDWRFLRDKLCPAAEICSYYKPYEGSERKKLDDFIKEVIIIETVKSGQEAAKEAAEVTTRVEKLSNKSLDVITTVQAFNTSRRLQAVLLHNIQKLKQHRLKMDQHNSHLKYHCNCMQYCLLQLQYHAHTKGHMKPLKGRIQQHMHHINDHRQQIQHHMQQMQGYVRHLQDRIYQRAEHVNKIQHRAYHIQRPNRQQK